MRVLSINQIKHKINSLGLNQETPESFIVLKNIEEPQDTFDVEDKEETEESKTEADKKAQQEIFDEIEVERMRADYISKQAELQKMARLFGEAPHVTGPRDVQIIPKRLDKTTGNIIDIKV